MVNKNIIEIWKIIKDFPNYAVSNIGRIKRIKSGRGAKIGYILKSQLTKKGYKSIKVSNNGIVKTRPVHRLILDAFDGPQPNLTGNHKDGDKTNNTYPDNLEWATYSENNKHAYETGLVGIKRCYKNYKLKDGEVWLIKKLLNSDLYKENNRKLTDVFISKMFKISRGVIINIKNNNSWKHIKYKVGE